MSHLLLAVLALALAGCAGSAQGAAPEGYVAGDGAAVIAPADREPAPDVVQTTLDGDTLSLGDLEGPVVVNFWASWCGPCVQEAPALRNVAKAYEGRVNFVGVNVKDQAAAARNFEQDFDVGYPSWHDESASIAASFGGIGPAALPSTLILDAEHRVAVRLFGAVTEPQLSAHLDSVLEEMA